MAPAGTPYLEITTTSLDNPDAIQPQAHIWTQSQRSYLKIKDDLPKYKEEQPRQE